MSAGATAIVGVTMVIAPGEIGWLLTFAFVSGGTALLFLGAPHARAGKPSRARIAVLNAAGAAGLVMTLVIDPVVAIGVAYLSYVIVVLAMARWPPSEWLAGRRDDRFGRGPIGATVAAGGTVWAMLAMAGVGFAASDSLAVQILVATAAWVATFGSWIWIALIYAGRMPRVRRADAAAERTRRDSR